MKRRVQGLQRIVNVRNTQKKLKVNALLKASNRCEALKDSALRIARLHSDTHANTLAEYANMLSAHMELSDRLLDAGHKMEVSINEARQEFAAAERQSFAARRAHDGTEKLLNAKQDKAQKAKNQKSDIWHNILYNIDNNRKKEIRDDC